MKPFFCQPLMGLLLFSLLSACNNISGLGENSPNATQQLSFEGFQCESTLPAVAKHALHKRTKTELLDRIKSFIFDLSSSETQAQNVWNHLISNFQIDQLIPQESYGQYERMMNSGAIGESLTQALFNAAVELSDHIMSSSTRRVAFIGPCAQNLPVNEACVHNFAQTLWQKLLYQTPSNELVDACVGLYQEHSDNWLQACFTHAFLSSELAYSAEIGSGASSSAPLTDLELAKRLARVFWMSAPDQQLLQWAESGEITANYDTAVDYVFNHSKFSEGLENFFYAYLGLEGTREVNFNSSEAVQARVQMLGLGSISSVTNYHEYAIEEALRFTRRMVLENRSFEDFLLSHESYASGPLAQAYGLPPYSDGQAPAHHPNGQRAGVLTLAALHLNAGTEKSHFHVGYEFLKKFTCRSTPPFPESMITDTLSIPEPEGLTSSVERSIHLTASPSCRSCHDSFDHLGFSLANIGPWGEFQDEEFIFNQETGEYFGTVDPDQTQSNEFFPGYAIETSSPTEFGKALLESKLPQACFTRNYFRWVFGRNEQLSTLDACALEAVYETLTDSNLGMKDALKALAKSDAFRTRSPEGLNP